MMRTLVLAVLLLLPALGAGAHELRPGFLEIRQSGAESYTVRLKVPARGDMRLGLYVRLPAGCRETGPRRSERAGDGVVDRLDVSCPDGLTGRTIAIDGLVATYTDVVARVELRDGSVQAARLTPDRPSFKVIGTPAWTDAARTYFALGVQHILLGIDHLLFVLVLLLLIRDRWMLVKTVTAFTIAHSITLAVATLGWAVAPQTPVEAVIALSICFAAAEVLKEHRGDASLARRAPWIVAFVFGLLHGFGFAGALREIGLPQADVPLALLTFNLGIEAGQLLFVFAVLAMIASLDRLLALSLPALRGATAYGIGCLAATWFVQRLVSFA